MTGEPQTAGQTSSPPPAFSVAMNRYWWAIAAALLCLVLAGAELAIESWLTGVDRSWAAIHGGHPVAKARRAAKPELLRVALLLIPTVVLDVASFGGRR
jgi:hypothetical protein